MIKGLGERLGMKREEAHLTCQQVAEKLGLSKSAISEYENDKSRPNIETLAKLAVMYKCTTDYLLGLHTDPSKLTADMSGLTEPERESILEVITCYEAAHSK